MSVYIHVLGVGEGGGGGENKQLTAPDDPNFAGMVYHTPCSSALHHLFFFISNYITCHV